MNESCHSQPKSWLTISWLIHMFDMTHSYAWHDSILRVAWLTISETITMLRQKHHVSKEPHNVWLFSRKKKHEKSKEPHTVWLFCSNLWEWEMSNLNCWPQSWLTIIWLEATTAMSGVISTKFGMSKDMICQKTYFVNVSFDSDITLYETSSHY